MMYSMTHLVSDDSVTKKFKHHFQTKLCSEKAWSSHKVLFLFGIKKTTILAMDSPPPEK